MEGAQTECHTNGYIHAHSEINVSTSYNRSVYMVIGYPHHVIMRCIQHNYGRPLP